MKSEEKQLITRAAVLLILANLIALTVWGLLFYQVSAKNVSYLKTASLLAAEKAKEENALSLEKFLSETRRERAFLDSYFVSEAAFYEFLEKIEEVAQLAGISESRRRLESPNKEGGDILSLRVSVTAPFVNVYRFLSLIENLSYKISIRDFQLNVATKEEGVGMWDGSFTLRLGSFTPKNQ